jgi:hypothetical protein
MSNIDLSEEEIIKKIFTWGLVDIVHKPDGYDRETLPEATSDNMLIYMEKINELVAEVNNLKRINSGLTDAFKNRKL